MAAMTEERAGDCFYTACGGSCPDNKVETYKIPAQCGSGTFQQRCCSPQYYPDVLILIDKGAGSIMQPFERNFDLPYADYSLLEEPFTNARLVKALPGELQCSCADGHWSPGGMPDNCWLTSQWAIANCLTVSQQSSTCCSCRQGNPLPAMSNEYSLPAHVTTSHCCAEHADCVPQQACISIC